jgi:hypothetical protein
MAAKIEIVRTRTATATIVNGNISPNLRKEYVSPSLGDADTFCQVMPFKIRGDLSHDLRYFHGLLV